MNVVDQLTDEELSKVDDRLVTIFEDGVLLVNDSISLIRERIVG